MTMSLRGLKKKILRKLKGETPLTSSKCGENFCLRHCPQLPYICKINLRFRRSQATQLRGGPIPFKKKSKPTPSPTVDAVSGVKCIADMLIPALFNKDFLEDRKRIWVRYLFTFHTSCLQYDEVRATAASRELTSSEKSRYISMEVETMQ